MSDRIVSDNPQPALRRSPKWEAKFGVVPREKKPENPTALLRAAFDMHRFGIAMKKQSLRRDHPDADEATIRRMLNDWMTAVPPHQGAGFAERSLPSPIDPEDS